MTIPSADTVAQQRLIVAILALFVAAISVFFALPNLLRYLEDRSKKKRQNAIRDALLRFGDCHTGDFLFHCPKLSQVDLEKGLEELQRGGEIVQYMDHTDRIKWRFRVNPQSVPPRYH